MKLLVMGAGYVGMALLSRLKNTPHEVFITTTSEDRVPLLSPYGKEVFVIQPNENLQEIIDSCDGMIILIAPKNPQSYEETYLDTAKRVSRALKGRQRPFHLLYTSSTSVCEGLQEEWVTEEMALHPESEKSKLLLGTERVYLSSNAQACILRLGGIYGPKRELMDRARRFSGKEMTGSGNEATNHIHLDDIVAALSFCLDHSLTGVYYLVNDDHISRKKLYSTFCNSMNVPPPIWNPESSLSLKNGYKVSNQKIKSAGFIFKHPLI